MTDYSDDFALHSLWQGGGGDSLAPLPLDEIKRRAGRLGDLVRRRNRIEYGAAAIVILGFALYTVILPGLLLKLGSLLTIAGALVVVWQLARRTSRPDPAAEAVDIRSHYRGRLVREEHMLSRVGRWYLGPLLPGLIVFTAGQGAIWGGAKPLGFAAFVAFTLLVFAGVWWLNHRAAAMLRAQIDRLDRTARAEGDSE